MSLQAYKKEVTAVQGDNPAVFDDSPTSATIKITDAKLYVPVVTLSTQVDNKLFKQFKELLHGKNTDQKCLIRLTNWFNI